jgi:hypothetical protein
MLSKITKYVCITILGIAAISCSTIGKKNQHQYPNQRWEMLDRGEIQWNFSSDSEKAHIDNIEMSGRKVSAIVSYGIDSLHKFNITREIIWPCLRVNLKKGDPDWMRYRAYLKRSYNDDQLPKLRLYGQRVPLSAATSVILNGTMQVSYKEIDNIEFKRILFPSTNRSMFMEQWKFTNHGKKPTPISIEDINKYETETGFYGVYEIGIKSDRLTVDEIQPGQTIEFGIYFDAHKSNDKLSFRIKEELQLRKAYITEMKGSLQLTTPDSLLNSAFLFAKIRTSESLFDSKMGLVHSPGGGRYYAGVWANDQVEYAGPFFPFLGYKPANEASLNAYNIFAGDMKKDVYKPIWSSHEMEGDLTCCGSDRGDAAMYLYGASRFLLALGDKTTAQKLFSSLDWCVEYNRHRLNPGGVVSSETDEMEGRLPTGDANLATSSLYYGGLNSAADLSTSIGLSRLVAGIYASYAKPLKDSIESYFGANVEGFRTYQYFKGYKKLRHWICIPMTVGIRERQAETVKALFTKLWTKNGLLVETGEKMFWDRGTLYALRGAFNADVTDSAFSKLIDYTSQRLLGDHVPYPVEAWPEGNQAQLAAESALFCRIFTEGLFGIIPTGIRTFDCSPRLPGGWNRMELNHIKAFQQDFRILVERKGNKLKVTVNNFGKLKYSKEAPEEYVHKISFEPPPPPKKTMKDEME